MNYRNLSNTNLKVSTICLGTMTYGKQNSSKEAFEQMDYALEHGVNFFDTAETYPSPLIEKTYGSTEKIIGNWLNKKKVEIKLYYHLKFLDRVCHGYVVEVNNTQNKILKVH